MDCECHVIDIKIDENLEQEGKFVYAFIDNKILLLRKLKDTITNENSVYHIKNKDTAVYIADRLYIESIFDKLNSNTVYNSINYKNKTYNIGDTIISNYDEQINLGIEYYLTDKVFKKNENQEITYYRNGQIKDNIVYLYKNIDIYKTHTKYYSNGVIKFIKFYRNNLLIDIVKEYFNDGSIMSSEEYYNGLLHGTCYYFYKNKNLKSELNYANNKLHGEQKYYYENGNLFVKTFFINGSREGQTKIYYEDGNIRSDGFYLNNKRIGIFFYYDEENNRKIIEVNKHKYKNMKYKFMKYPCKKSITWTINLKENDFEEIKEQSEDLEDYVYVNINDNGNIETELVKNLNIKDFTCKHDIENEIDYFEKIYNSNYYKISELEDIQEEDEFINEKEILEELNISFDNVESDSDIKELINSVIDQILNE